MFDEPNKERFTLMQTGGPKKRSLMKWLKLLFFVAVAGLIVAYALKLRDKRPDIKSLIALVPGDSEPEVETPSGVPDSKLFEESMALLKQNDYSAARTKAYKALAAARNPEIIRRIEKMLGEINIELATTPKPMEEKEDYIVKAGDTLDKISKQFGTTIELIQKSNNIRGSIIRPGDKLRIFSAKMTIHVGKTENYLLLLANDRFFKRYRVGTGKYGTTPVGTFRVQDKIVNPPWWTEGRVVPFGDEENVLGTRWMAITAVGETEPVFGYGIHGTWEPETIGSQSSAGCVRLLNSDVEELYMLVPRGTEVVVYE